MNSYMPISLTTLVSIFLTQPSVDGYDVTSNVIKSLLSCRSSHFFSEESVHGKTGSKPLGFESG